MGRTETNYRLGRIMYQAETDAAGYPNGMPYWEEMTADDKYWYCLKAIDFLEKIKKDLRSEVALDFGIGDSVYGKGECRELMDYIDSVHDAELKDFEERVALIRNACQRDREDRDA